MQPGRGTPAPDPWWTFQEDYRRRMSCDPSALAAHQLFTNLRDASVGMALRELLKAFYFWICAIVGRRLDGIELHPRYDYAFVIDGTGAPGLATSLPVLKAVPPGRRVLLLVRHHVLGDPRFQELAGNAAFTIIDIDRLRIPFWRWAKAVPGVFQMALAYPRAMTSGPKLFLRKVHSETLMEQLLNRVSFGCLVVSNERLVLPSAAIQAARRRGIHTACFQHGALVEQYLPVTVDTYLTWGARANEWFRDRNVSARLCDIGSTRADHLSTYLGRLVPAEARRTVVWFSQPPGTDLPLSYTERVETEFLSLLQHPEWTLWVKPHPSEDPSRWEQAAAASSGRLRVRKEGNPYQVISESAYVGAFYSTVLLEAMLFEKPVFQLNPYPGEAPDYSLRAGGAPIPDGAALHEWLGRCDADEGFRRRALDRQQEYARGYFSHLGKASQAFYECLDPIAQAPSPIPSGSPPRPSS